jgi:hypothetical protein
LLRSRSRKIGRPHADLAAYAGSSLQQEIVAEGATRNIPACSRFLTVAALSNGTIVNFTNNSYFFDVGVVATLQAAGSDSERRSSARRWRRT